MPTFVVALEEVIDDNVACILLLFFTCVFRIKTEMIGNI